MDFEQINSVTFRIRFESLDDMGKIAMEGISFFNHTFSKLVKEVNCEWDTHKITFILRGDCYSVDNINSAMRGTKNSVQWVEKEFKILWKKVKTAESYHSAGSEQALREEYKDSVACLCNHQDGEYKIDKIIAD